MNFLLDQRKQNILLYIVMKIYIHTRRPSFVEESAFKNKLRFAVIQTNKLGSQNKFTARVLCFKLKYTLGLLCHHYCIFHQYYVLTIQRKTENYSLFVHILPTPYCLSNWQRRYIKKTLFSLSHHLSISASLLAK
jgi:hypothetical protein